MTMNQAILDPSYIEPYRKVAFNGNEYLVGLSCGNGSVVRVIKNAGRPSQYLSTIKPGSQNWKRAVKLARAALVTND